MPVNDPSRKPPCFILTRFFEAPRELVWKAWSEADQLQAWWGPKDCACGLPHECRSPQIAAVVLWRAMARCVGHS